MRFLYRSERLDLDEIESRLHAVRDYLAAALVAAPTDTYCLTSEEQAVHLLVLDDALAESVATDCHDPAHDPRWCATCEARKAAIDAYREKVEGESNGK